MTARGEQVVDLLIRFGLLLGTTLQRWISGLSSDAARKSLERLADDGWITKHTFPNGQPYFTLSNSACYRLALKRNGAALRQRPLTRRLLVLLHFSANRELRLLTPAECRTSLADIYRRGAGNYFFIDTTRDSLGWICIDDGKPLNRIRSKTFNTAAKKRTITQLRELALAGKFKLLLLTTSEPKRDKLIELFAAQPIRELPLEVHAVPECTSYLGLTS